LCRPPTLPAKLLTWTSIRTTGGMVKSCGRRVLIDHVATLVSASSGRSMSTPFSNLAPADEALAELAPS
jgi:hypothetical protein